MIFLPCIFSIYDPLIYKGKKVLKKEDRLDVEHSTDSINERYEKELE